MVITIVLPGEPSSKGRPRFNRTSGRTYTPAKTANYEGMLRDAAAKVMSGRLPLQQPCAVNIVAFFAIPKSMKKADRARAEAEELPVVKKPDADNIAKIAMDPLNGIVWRDDSQAYRVTVEKLYSPRPRLVVEVAA